MKNVTITVEEGVLEWARVQAAKRGSSLARRLGELLGEMQRREDAYERAYQEWRNDTRRWRSDGAPYPKRDEIYDRGRLK